MSPPSVGPDGSVYFSRSLAYLDSVTPNGQLRWTFFDGSIIDHPAVSPDGSIVVAGNRPNFGEPGSARAWNASTGALAWQVDLPNENGGYQIAFTQPRVLSRQRDCVLRYGSSRRRRPVLVSLRGGHGQLLTQCVVPGVIGMTLEEARVQISRGRMLVMTGIARRDLAGCVAQSPSAGAVLPLWSPVHLTVLHS